MKKNLLFPLFMITVFSVVIFGCTNQQQNGEYIQDEDSLSSLLPDSALYGHLGEGTGMSCLELVTNDGDTLVLNKTNEKTGRDGIILGEIANYTDQFSILTSNDNQSVAIAININQLTQGWQSHTDPKHGFVLSFDGNVKNIKNAQRKYNKWELYNCKLVLRSEINGIHGAEIQSDTLTILDLTPDSMTVEYIKDRRKESFHHIL